MNIELNKEETLNIVAETISRNLNVPIHTLQIDIKADKYLTVDTLCDAWRQGIGKTDYDINLARVKIPLIKLFRSMHFLTGFDCGLKCAKDFVEGHIYNP